MRLRRENGDFTLKVDVTNPDDIHGTWPKNLLPEQFIGEIIHVKTQTDPQHAPIYSLSVIGFAERGQYSDVLCIISTGDVLGYLWYNPTTGEFSSNKDALTEGDVD